MVGQSGVRVKCQSKLDKVGSGFADAGSDHQASDFLTDFHSQGFLTALNIRKTVTQQSGFNIRSGVAIAAVRVQSIAAWLGLQ